MKGRENLHWKAVAVLLLPAIFLGGLALSLREKPAAVLSLSSGPTKLTVSEIKFHRLPDSRGEQRVSMTIYVSYVGAEPKWWQAGVSASWLQNERFVNQQGREYAIYTSGGGPRAFDAKRQSHVLEYTCSVPAGHDITKPGTFQGTAVFANQLVPLKALGIARFAVPVRL